ncbi:hypothetical protein BLOT_006915 [Blomia tropicalis]|nr:hypothetical protein BLOT_006915 [Blomia tropicalis]
MKMTRHIWKFSQCETFQDSMSLAHLSCSTITLPAYVDYDGKATQPQIGFTEATEALKRFQSSQDLIVYS